MHPWRENFMIILHRESQLQKLSLLEGDSNSQVRVSEPLLIQFSYWVNWEL